MNFWQDLNELTQVKDIYSVIGNVMLTVVTTVTNKHATEDSPTVIQSTLTAKSAIS
jgi:hypothetical protein